MNPITLFIFILIASFLTFIGNNIIYYILLVMSFLVLMNFSILEFIKRIVFFITMIILMKLLSLIDLGITTGALMGLILLVLKLYPVFNIGRVLILTSPLKIMSALRYIKAPNIVSIALVTALRYLGELKLRIKELKNGMKIRGLKVSILHPVRSLELYLVPLIYKCLHVSETLTSSIISRGIEYQGTKTSYNPICFNILDFSTIIITFLLLGVTLWEKF